MPKQRQLTRHKQPPKQSIPAITLLLDSSFRHITFTINRTSTLKAPSVWLITVWLLMINKERKIKYVRVCECLCKYGLCYHISCKFAVKKSAEKTKRGWKMTDTQWEAGWSWWESHGCCSSSFLSAAFKQSGDTVSEGGHCNTPPVTDHVLSEYVQPLPRGAVSAEHPLVRTSPEARASMGLGGGVGVGGFSWAARSSQSDPPLRVRASVGGRDAGQQWQPGAPWLSSVLSFPSRGSSPPLLYERSSGTQTTEPLHWLLAELETSRGQSERSNVIHVHCFTIY